jgi:hypothetical protein
MGENLFFIPIIAQALRGHNVENALRKAFQKIKRMGADERHAEGYRNFELFMEEAYNRYQITATDHVRELIDQLGTGMLEGPIQEKGSLLDIIRSQPEWEAEYKEFCCMEADENRTRDFPVIEVSNDKGLIIRKTFEKVPSRISFKDIVPGSYKIKLVNTGWIIWEGELTTKELIWTTLHMAAETKGTQKQPTNEIDLLDNGKIILHTYAGSEKGSIEIKLAR